MHFIGLTVTLAALAAGALTAGEPTWVIGNGEVPALAVYAGSENSSNYYVCRGEHLGGLHPGKLHAGKCNIEFNWGEIPLDNYEVLLEEPDYIRWVADSMGAAPADAFPVGQENGGILYSCAGEVLQKDEAGNVVGSLGTHAGKLYASNCNIPYGGGAFLAERYAVLVILTPTALEKGPVTRRAPAAPSRFRGAYDLNGRQVRWEKVRTGADAPWLIKR